MPLVPHPHRYKPVRAPATVVGLFLYPPIVTCKQQLPLLVGPPCPSPHCLLPRSAALIIPTNLTYDGERARSTTSRAARAGRRAVRDK